MRSCIAVVAGLLGLWLFIGGLMSVLMTEPGAFIPVMWSNLLLGSALLAGSVLLWRGRARHGTGRQGDAADGRSRLMGKSGGRRSAPMSIPAEVLDLENRSIGASGEPTLGLAYERLLAVWRRGSREREVGLHLLFLAWYLLCEPPHLTGLNQVRTASTTLAGVFREVHEWFHLRIRSDAEMLYVVGLMAHLFPHLLGDAEEFEALAREYRRLYRSLAPDGISPEVFSRRGAYGEYFAGQAKLEGGF